MKNLKIEPYGRVNDFERLKGLIENAYSKLPLHWKELLPNFRVIITPITFDHVPILKEAVVDRNRIIKRSNRKLSKRLKMKVNDEWKICQDILAKHNRKIVLYMRMNEQSIYSDPDYYFQKDFMNAIAGILMAYRHDLCRVVNENATGEARKSLVLALTAFRSSFKRYFINADWLKENKEDAYFFMRKLDEIVKKGGISSRMHIKNCPCRWKNN